MYGAARAWRGGRGFSCSEATGLHVDRSNSGHLVQSGRIGVINEKKHMACVRTSS